MQDAADEITLRDEEGVLRADFLHAVEAALEAGDTKTVRELTLDLHEADLADLLVQVQYYFNVAVSTKAVTLFFQFLAQAHVIVDLAVADDCYIVRFVENGLLPATDINNGEPAHADAERPADAEPLAVRASVLHDTQHGLNIMLGHRILFEIEDSGDAAHGKRVADLFGH